MKLSSSLYLTGTLASAFFVGCKALPESMNTTKIRKVPQTAVSAPKTGAEFNLAQPWRDALESDFRSARVWMGWNSEVLHVQATLRDDAITTMATADNQKMWELGDVFEIFLMVEGRKDYVEMHVTPNNMKLHLRLPGVGGRAGPDDPPLEYEEMLISPVEFDSMVAHDQNKWTVQATIPASVLGLERFQEGLRLRVAFARYDAAADRKPILSTTASHPIASFHRPDEWTPIQLVSD